MSADRQVFKSLQSCRNARSFRMWRALASVRTVALLVVCSAVLTAVRPLVALGEAKSHSPVLPEAAKRFLAEHCADCHQGAAAEAGLNLDALSTDLHNEHDVSKWVRIHDRVQSGEMPPPESSSLSKPEAVRFTTEFGHWLHRHQKQLHDAAGRVRGRRLTNLQLERSLHAVLGIDIPLAHRLPDEPRTDGYTTVASGQSMSHFQIQHILQVIDVALDEAFRRATSRPDEWSRKIDAKTLSRRRPKSRTREPEFINDQAVTWSSGLVFYGRLPATTAREDGWYRFTVRASALKPPTGRGVWCTVRSGRHVSTAPLQDWIGAFEATAQPKTIVYEAWLPAGHLLEIRPGDVTLKRARFRGGQVGPNEGGPQNVPGVALDWIVMERIHRGPDNPSIRKLLFGEVRPNQFELPREQTAAESAVKELMTRFASRAFRRPVTAEDIAGYLDLAIEQLNEGQSFAEALQTGYRALLCSPRFLHFHEQPGSLDDYALASRLSYFLWNAPPDRELLQLAEAGQLKHPAELRKQVDRMLQGEAGQRFVDDFTAEWLDLSLIDFTQPDRKLYRDFDPVVQNSMVAETQKFFAKLLHDDAPVGSLIQSDFTFLNSRLARFYGIDEVKGDELQVVSLNPESLRGGLMTQGAILKVTANGTTTSPVVRGVWLSERLLGQTIPPPPKSVPAIEPDIRGATTIREMLAKHRSDASCMSCHKLIDPPGFALENFDPAGKFRSHYPKIERGRRKQGAKIDASAQLVDGRKFRNLREFQQLVLADPQKLARNLAEEFLTYGTGAPVAFADRPALEKLIEQAAKDDYGIRSILKHVVTSPVFLQK